MTFTVATNVVASRLPERRPTGTTNALSNNSQNKTFLYKVLVIEPQYLTLRTRTDLT